MTHPLRSRRVQAGLTLVEFMIAIVIGMILIAALATLIANQSQSRGEVDRIGKMIENGRYAVRQIADDAQLAGYWGELGTERSAPTATANPCSKVVADLEDAMGNAVQGFDSTAGSFPSCISNRQPGTDVLVIRRVDTSTSDVTATTAGQVYLQTGLSNSEISWKIAAGTGSDDSTTFSLKKKDGTTANTRKYLVHIWYVSQCSVEVSGSCTNADGGTPIPTLKRVDLSAASGTATFTTTTIAEGIENMQIDYGLDSDSDGYPNGTDTSGSTFTKDDWYNVVSLKIYLLARSTEKSPGFTESKSYALGTYGTVSPTDGYRRHAFVQSVRLVNPSGRRAS